MQERLEVWQPDRAEEQVQVSNREDIRFSAVISLFAELQCWSREGVVMVSSYSM